MKQAFTAMAHNGKVVFESYPGMNPTDMHIWMSASKTVTGLLAVLLEAEGKIDFERPEIGARL
jgi:CubicO group peptidase (beta-lactamase class C family)